MRVAESTYREQFLSNVEVAAQVEQQNAEAGLCIFVMLPTCSHFNIALSLLCSR